MSANRRSKPRLPRLRGLRRRALPVSAGAKRTAVLGGVLVAVVAAPIALASGEGDVIGGQRNPTTNASNTYKHETEIIAENSTYGTRQSNKGTGGGAIYGCRSATTGNACIAAVNLREGRAFAFSSAGSVGGTITLENPLGAPLTTNATGVATGFNANFLQGHQASEFLGATGEAANSAKLGGVAASSYVQTSSLLFADVGPTGTLGSHNGATTSGQTSDDAYTVTFSTSAAECSLTASPVGPGLTSGSLGVAVSASNNDNVIVTAPSPLAEGFDLQVIC